MPQFKLNTIKLDEFGRVIITDEKILTSISGAIQHIENNILDNVGCPGPNDECGNTSC